MTGRRWGVVVICTDRGRHKRAVLVRIRPPAIGLSFRGGKRHWMTLPGTMNSEPELFNGTRSFKFRCPRCPRDVRIGQDWFSDLLVRCYESGLYELDISLLPF